MQPAPARLHHASRLDEPARPHVPPAWIEHDGGLVEIGHDGDGFGFDNEFPRHAAHLEPFALADRPVTCGEWLAFMDDGGYGRPELWLSDGWATAQAERWDAPLYWFKVVDDWWLFTLGGPQLVDLAEPVCHMSYYEADAFARWAGGRLPTEAEWEAVAVDRSPDGQLPRPVGPASAARGARARRSSATCGSGRRAPTARIRGSAPRPGRWASTTASSW